MRKAGFLVLSCFFLFFLVFFFIVLFRFVGFRLPNLQIPLLPLGLKSFSNVLEPLTNAANFFALRERVLPLHASTVLSADGLKSTLLFDATASFGPGDLCAPANLFSSLRTVCGEHGLYKAFKGLSHSQEALDRKLGYGAWGWFRI
jgi:hypothetical protein